ncbi:hypothetical protein D3C86_1890010 [compost metagenome]
MYQSHCSLAPLIWVSARHSPALPPTTDARLPPPVAPVRRMMLITPPMFWLP